MKKHNEFCIIQQQIEENANSDCDILRLTHGRWNREKKVTKHFVTYKILTALFFLVILVLTLVMLYIKTEWFKFYFIYATNWTFILMTFGAILEAILVIVRYRGEKNISNWQFIGTISIWISSMTYAGEMLITFCYWTAIHDWTSTNTKYNDAAFYFNLTHHLAPALIGFFDTIISNRVWEIWHVVFPVFYGYFYAIFNVIYVMLLNGQAPTENGSYENHVYDFMNWINYPRNASVCSFAIFPASVCVSFALFHYLTKLRDYLWGKYYGTEIMEDIKQCHYEETLALT